MHQPIFNSYDVYLSGIFIVTAIVPDPLQLF